MTWCLASHDRPMSNAEFIAGRHMDELSESVVLYNPSFGVNPLALDHR